MEIFDERNEKYTDLFVIDSIDGRDVFFRYDQENKSVMTSGVKIPFIQLVNEYYDRIKKSLYKDKSSQREEGRTRQQYDEMSPYGKFWIENVGCRFRNRSTGQLMEKRVAFNVYGGNPDALEALTNGTHKEYSREEKQHYKDGIYQGHVS